MPVSADEGSGTQEEQEDDLIDFLELGMLSYMESPQQLEPMRVAFVRAIALVLVCRRIQHLIRGHSGATHPASDCLGQQIWKTGATCVAEHWAHLHLSLHCPRIVAVDMFQRKGKVKL